MASYLIFESRDPFDSRDIDFSYSTAKELAAAGNSVTIFFVQNGVLPLRKGNQFSSSVDELHKHNVEIWADDFSLRERGFSRDDMLPIVKLVSMDHVVKTLVEDRPKAFWH